MKWFLYNVLFALAYCVVLPSFLLRMKRRGGYRARMGDRFGRYPDDLALPPDPIWIHAVSVGEARFDGDFLQMPVSMAHSGIVSIRLYSVLGTEVANVNRMLSAGTSSVLISRKKVPAGIYMMSVVTASSYITKRIDLSK
jgi:hypothetical protein